MRGGAAELGTLRARSTPERGLAQTPGAELLPFSRTPGTRRLAAIIVPPDLHLTTWLGVDDDGLTRRRIPLPERALTKTKRPRSRQRNELHDPNGRPPAAVGEEHGAVIAGAAPGMAGWTRKVTPRRLGFVSVRAVVLGLQLSAGGSLAFVLRSSQIVVAGGRDVGRRRGCGAAFSGGGGTSEPAGRARRGGAPARSWSAASVASVGPSVCTSRPTIHACTGRSDRDDVVA